MISFLFIKWTKLYYVCSLYEQYQDIRFYKLFTEEFYDIKTNSAAADNKDFHACHIFRIVINVVDHSKDRSNLAVFFIDAVMETFGRRKQWCGPGRAYDQVWMELTDIFRCSCCIFENVKIVKLFCSVDQVVREISQAFLGRDLWNNRSKTTKSFVFFQKESVTTYFSGCTGSFQSGSATADDYNITFLWYVNYITGPFINLIDNICDIIKLIYGCKKKIR